MLATGQGTVDIAAHGRLRVCVPRLRITSFLRTRGDAGPARVGHTPGGTGGVKAALPQRGPLHTVPASVRRRERRRFSHLGAECDARSRLASVLLPSLLSSHSAGVSSKQVMGRPH